jgi:hypothetical protein
MWDLRVPSVRLQFNFGLGFAGRRDPKGAFCEQSHSDRLAAMLAYDGSIGDGKVTRITVFGPLAVQGAA